MPACERVGHRRQVPGEDQGQSRIEPWRATTCVMEYSVGVSRLLFAATKAIEKSWSKRPLHAYGRKDRPASTQKANVRHAGTATGDLSPNPPRS